MACPPDQHEQRHPGYEGVPADQVGRQAKQEQDTQGQQNGRFAQMHVSLQI
jgi:hypothetical protein